MRYNNNNNQYLKLSKISLIQKKKELIKKVYVVSAMFHDDGLTSATLGVYDSLDKAEELGREQYRKFLEEQGLPQFVDHHLVFEEFEVQ